MDKKASFFYKKLINWYLKNKRELPWRKTNDPYKIWLSEIMLQQTRVAQGLPYYHKFLKAFPTIKELALAHEDEILKLWQGLGYYSRARNLHATAQNVYYNMDGVFPLEFKEILKLKGVGDYTASAIASISYNQPYAVVDGNVYRVLSRVFSIDTPINSSSGIKEFKKLAQELIDTDQPGIYNQAIMEFGARYCVPQNPECSNCIFNDRCLAFKNKKVAALPVKIKSKPVKKRYFNYMVIVSENEKTLLRQRTQKGIWQKLYEFPLIETTTEISPQEINELESFKDFSENLNIESISLYNEENKLHKLSHQHLYTKFWIVKLNEILSEENMIDNKSIPFSEIKEYAVPVLIADFVAEFFEAY